jgi:ACR3 family arsenite transporter
MTSPETGPVTGPVTSTGTTTGTRIAAFAAALERHQIALCLAAIAVGALLSAVPGTAAAEAAVTPVLGLLLFATFLGVPLISLGGAFRDLRFLAAVGVLNFVVVPAVAFGLSRFVAADDALLVGVLLVLLTPCVDYVIVFSGIAGGASERLLAAAPLLMLAQLLLLPLYLLLFTGPALIDLIDPAPFAQALVFLILLPLGAAALVQWGVRRAPRLRVVEATAQTAMVPLLMATLLLVVASQLHAVLGSLGALAGVVPIYAAFLVVMVPLGMAAARVARLDVPASRALVFSGATRNSLVVLALALPLSGSLALVPLVVVTQTLVELVGLLVLIRLIPRILPDALPGGPSSGRRARSRDR